MLRYVLWRRSRALLALSTGGFLAGGLFAGAIAQRMGAGSTGILLAAGVGGLVLACLMGAVVVWTNIGADTREALLLASYPDDIVIQAIRGRTEDVRFSHFATWALFAGTVGFTFTVVVTSSDVSVWIGGRSPKQFIVIPWSDVTYFGLGSRLEGAAPGQYDFARLRLSATDDDGRHDVEFGVESLTSFGVTRYADEAALREIAEQIAVRSNGRTVGAESAVTPVHSAGLVPGRTAHFVASMTARLSVLVPALIALTIGLGVFVAMFTDGRLLPLLIVVAVVPPTLVRIALAVLLTRSKGRERSAGYTTLNRQELDLEQRHPVTGVTLRAAGAVPLSKGEFARLLGR